MVELGVQGQRADGEQNEGDIGIHEVIQDPLLERHVKDADRLTDQIEVTVLPSKRFTGLPAICLKSSCSLGAT